MSYSMALTLSTLGLGALLAESSTTWTNTPFLPAAWPLAVKGPYINSWQSGGKGVSALPTCVPAFWPAWDDQTTWTLTAVVDETPYRIMGAGPAPGPPNVTFPNQTNVINTSTRTIFTFSMGLVDVNATFLSPVTPNDLVRQSLPFAYLYLDLSSTDGAAHDVRIYSDITPQWLHGNEVRNSDPDPEVTAIASLIDSSKFIGLQMQLKHPQPFVEVAEHAQDVIGVFATKFNSAAKYQVGTDVTVRTLGYNSTGLQNTVDANDSTLSLNGPFNAYAITLDLGAIQSTTEPVVFTIGMLRDPSINVTTASGTTQLRSSYYWSNFSTIPDIISFVLDDFDAARSTADAFDDMIQNVSLSRVAGYTDLLALSVRQVFGALEITVSKASDGKWNQSDVMIFAKDMGDLGSTGSFGGTNVVDVLYAGFPALLFLNPQLGRYVLLPILESQVTSNGSFVAENRTYAPRHLGNQFPNASSDTSLHNLGIEQSGNMLIMVLAHLQATNDPSVAQNYYPLLMSWADYLVNQTFNAGYQTTSVSDGITSFNQTNLVLKGIIGISAMSSISGALDKRNDQLTYQKTADQYIQAWMKDALSKDGSHLLSFFEDQSSSGLIYNMYADKLLGLNLIPSNISSIQTEFYNSLLSAGRTPFGIPLDSGNSSLSRLDWTIFSVSSILDDGGDNAPVVFQQAISVLNNYVTSQTNNSPLAIIYDPGSGESHFGSNSFAVGSLFAPLVMGAKSLANNTSNQETTTGHKGVLGPTLGGVIGGIAAFLASILFFFIFRRNRTASASGVRISSRTKEITSPFDTSSAPSPTTQSYNTFPRQKYPPPLQETIADSFATSSTQSMTEEVNDRLADLALEIQRVRDEVRNRRIPGAEDDEESEAPPSYSGRNPKS